MKLLYTCPHLGFASRLSTHKVAGAVLEVVAQPFVRVERLHGLGREGLEFGVDGDFG